MTELTESDQVVIFIKEAREKAGLSIPKLAKMLKYDETNLYKIEKGEKMPGAYFLFRLANVLKLDLILYDKSEFEF